MTHYRRLLSQGAGAGQLDPGRSRAPPAAVSRMMKDKRQMRLSEAVQIADFLAISQGKCAPCRRHRRAPAGRRTAARSRAPALDYNSSASAAQPSACCQRKAWFQPPTGSCWKSTQLSVTAYAEHKPLLAGDHFKLEGHTVALPVQAYGAANARRPITAPAPVTRYLRRATSPRHS
jgi:hypothetical protein